MEQISFYLDEHIHRAIADGLRHRGVDVLTVKEAGKSGVSDREQLDFARSQQRVMVTTDSDFLMLASEGISHAGIAYANPPTLGRRTDRIADAGLQRPDLSRHDEPR